MAFGEEFHGLGKMPQGKVIGWQIIHPWKTLHFAIIALLNTFDYSKKISCCQNSAKRFIRKQTLLSVPEDQRTNDISTLKMTQGLIFCKIFKLKA